MLVRINRYYKKNFNLILIGKSDNGNYQDRLNLIVKKNYLSKNVKFLTNISEEKLKFYYQKSHLFTMLSEKIGNHFEGFGIEINLESKIKPYRPQDGIIKAGEDGELKRSRNKLSSVAWGHPKELH